MPPGPAVTEVAACRDGGFTAAAVVDVVPWPAVLQMLHRLTRFPAAG